MNRSLSDLRIYTNLNDVGSCGDIKQLVASSFIGSAHSSTIHIHLCTCHALTLGTKNVQIGSGTRFLLKFFLTGSGLTCLDRSTRPVTENPWTSKGG